MTVVRQFMQRVRRTPRFHALLLCGVMALGAYLRVVNLPDNPAWYTDEITHVEIARHLLRGDVRYFAVSDSFLIFARLPLFEYLLAGVFRLTGVSVAALRGLTALCGIITGVLLYLTLRQIQPDAWRGLAVCGVWFCLPDAVLYNRFGFSYNLLLPLLVIMLWSFYRYRKSREFRRLLPGVLCLAAGTLSDVMMWSFLPLLILVTVGIRLRDGILALLLACLPAVFYAGWQLLHVPDAFLFDLSYTLARTGGDSLPQQIARLIDNYLVLLQHPVWLIGIIGLFLLKDRTLQTVIALMCLPLLLVGRTVPLYNLSAYYTLPFLPLIAIGVGTFFVRATYYLTETFGSVRGAAACLLLIVPVVASTSHTVQQVQDDYTTTIAPFLIQPHDARRAADFLNAQANPGDTVIASAPVGWLIDGSVQVVEFQMAAIADGDDAVHLPGNLPDNRLLFDVSPRQADYIVIDNLWRNWGAVHIPQIARLVQSLAQQEPVFSAGEIAIYRADTLQD